MITIDNWWPQTRRNNPQSQKFQRPTTMTGRKIDVSKISLPFRKKIQDYIGKEMNGLGPRLVGFLANEDPSAKKYAEWTAKACKQDGIQYELRQVAQDQLESALKEANEDQNVHGIMIYYPCFGSFPSFYGGTMDEFLRDSISVQKDVEGLCHYYRGNLYRNHRFVDADTRLKKCVLPCTPLAIAKILEDLGVYDFDLPVGQRLENQTITIINRSDIVGRPLAAMLANDGAQVYSIDVDSMYVFRRGHLSLSEDVSREQACRQSKVIITGVPVKDYRLPLEWVKPRTVVINVSSYKNVSITHGLFILPQIFRKYSDILIRRTSYSQLTSSYIHRSTK